MIGWKKSHEASRRATDVTPEIEQQHALATEEGSNRNAHLASRAYQLSVARSLMLGQTMPAAQYFKTAYVGKSSTSLNSTQAYQCCISADKVSATLRPENCYIEAYVCPCSCHQHEAIVSEIRACHEWKIAWSR